MMTRDMVWQVETALHANWAPASSPHKCNTATIGLIWPDWSLFFHQSWLSPPQWHVTNTWATSLWIDPFLLNKSLWINAFCSASGRFTLNISWELGPNHCYRIFMALIKPEIISLILRGLYSRSFWENCKSLPRGLIGISLTSLWV